MINLWADLYLCLLAFILASLEVEIEGAYGWAKKLPTWRPAEDEWYAKFFKKMMHGKELTGYHLHVFGLIFLFFMLPFEFGVPFTLINFLEILSIFFLFIVLWDFLWFVINPHIDLNNFKTEAKIIHKEWLGIFPVDYYFGVAMSLLCYLPVAYEHWPIGLLKWTMTFTLFAFFTILIILIEPYVRRIKRS
ncbi:MAG: hypothetical protein WCW02_02620 [Candidatus Buchananbacteria bacterium]